MYRLPPSPLLRRKSLATAAIPIFTKGNGPHEYGCVLAPLPEPIYSQIIDWGRRIVPDCDLGPDGREDRPHVTIKYGFRRHGDDTVRAVRRLLEQHGPIKIRLKGVSLFEGNPGGDVLKIDVDSPELHKLNSILTSSFPCIDKYRRYVPHITIAYLLPGVSFKYKSSLVGNDPILHQTLELTELEWSGANGRRETIQLRGKIGFGPSPFGMRRKALTVPYIKSGYFADCPRDRSGHCKPKNEGDESGQGRQEEQPRQGQQQEQSQQNQQQPQEKEPPAPDKPDPETGQLVEQMQDKWTQAKQAEENRDYLRMGKLRREAREMGQNIFRRLVTPAVAVRPGAVQFKPLSVDKSEWIDETGVVRSARGMASVFYGIDPRDEDFDKKVEAVHDDARKELDALPEDFAQQKAALKGKTTRLISALGAPDGSFKSGEYGEVLYWMTPGGHALLSTGEAGVVWPREKIDKIIKQNQRKAVRADKKALSYLDTTSGGALIPPPKKRRVDRTRLFETKAFYPPRTNNSRLRQRTKTEDTGGDDQKIDLVAEILAGLFDENILRQTIGESGEKSLTSFRIKAGFTGEKKDKLGRRYCWNQGRRVPCTKPTKTSKPKGKKEGDNEKKKTKPKKEKPQRPTVDESYQHIQDMLQGEIGPGQVNQLTDHLMQMTIRDLVELKKKLGLKAASARKVDYARKIAERALGKEEKTPPKDKKSPNKEKLPPDTIKDEPTAPEKTDKKTTSRDDDWPTTPLSKEIYTPQTGEENNILFKQYRDDESRPFIPLTSDHDPAPPSLSAQHKQIFDTLPKEQQMFLRMYTGNDAVRINRLMRSCPETLNCFGKWQKMVDNVDKAIAAFGRLETPITVWRKINLDAAELNNMFGTMESALKSGQEIRMAGFKSTSVSPSYPGMASAMFEIRARTGAYVRPFSLNANEQEFLQGHNTRYRVTGIKEVSFDRADGRRSMKKIIQLEEVE